MRLKDAMKDMLDTLRDIKNAVDGDSSGIHLYPSWDDTCEAIDNARKADQAAGKAETRFTLSIDAESDCYVLTVLD